MKLSVVISAYNEEKKIKDCIESVKWADEIIVIDNSSTDKTAQIAGEYTKKIYTQKNDPFNIDIQKNLGIEKATGDWVLVLDADERVPKELAKEINSKLPARPGSLHEPCTNSAERQMVRSGGSSVNSQLSGYLIPRKNIIFGKWIRHSGWYPDYQLRLFRRGLGKYEKRHVHEPLNVQGRIEKLNEPLIHYNYETISQFLYKHLQVYAPNEAEELLRKGYIFDWKAAIRMPMSEFLSRFFAREGYKDGFHGLILALLMGVYHLAIFAYVWEKKMFQEVQDENIIRGLEEELKKSRKELTYWISSKKIEQEKNVLTKTTLKIKRKLRL